MQFCLYINSHNAIQPAFKLVFWYIDKLLNWHPPRGEQQALSKVRTRQTGNLSIALSLNKTKQSYSSLQWNEKTMRPHCQAYTWIHYQIIFKLWLQPLELIMLSDAMQ